MRLNSLRLAGMLLASFGLLSTRPASAFDYKRYTAQAAPTLSVSLQGQAADGTVTVNGGDSAQPTEPFRFDFGDGTTVVGWFPQVHRYSDARRNYIVTVTAFYALPTGADGGGDSNQFRVDQAQAVVRYVAPVLVPANLPAAFAVRFPDPAPTLLGYTGRPLGAFAASVFGASFPSTSAEQVLGTAAMIGRDLVNDDLRMREGTFVQQIVQDNTLGGGGYSLWFTTPVALALGPTVVSPTLRWSTVLHEMGHNFTLNTPAATTYGGRVDGDANAIYAETMAQIFQHVAGFELITYAANHGIPQDVAAELAIDLGASMSYLRRQHDAYLDAGRRYVDWNDHGPAGDPTLATFMALAFRFIDHAEREGVGYRIPFKRMMAALQQFDAGWAARYAGTSSAPAASAFRASLMVAAMSHAFSIDMRAEFRDLGFPVDDAIHAEVLGRADRGSTALRDLAACLLDWGEATYPTLLAPAAAPTLDSGPYHYRRYTGSDLYVGVSQADRHLYTLQAGRLGDLGSITDWLGTAGCL